MVYRRRKKRLHPGHRPTVQIIIRRMPGLQKDGLSANSAANEKLKNKENSLQVKFAPGKNSSSITNTISSKKFILDNNALGAKALTFNFTNGICELTASYENGDRKLSFGMNKWEKQRNGILLNTQLPFPVSSLPNVVSPVAANATWKDEKTLYLEIRPVETVTGDSITCTFTNDTIKLVFLDSVARGGKGQERRPELSGKIA